MLSFACRCSSGANSTPTMRRNGSSDAINIARPSARAEVDEGEVGVGDGEAGQCGLHLAGIHGPVIHAVATTMAVDLEAGKVGHTAGVDAEARIELAVDLAFCQLFRAVAGQQVAEAIAQSREKATQ